MHQTNFLHTIFAASWKKIDEACDVTTVNQCDAREDDRILCQNSKCECNFLGYSGGGTTMCTAGDKHNTEACTNVGECIGTVGFRLNSHFTPDRMWWAFRFTWAHKEKKHCTALHVVNEVPSHFKG